MPLHVRGYVYYCHITEDTGKRVAERLDFRHGSSPPPSNTNIVIRWGNSSGLGFIPPLVINKQVAMNNAIDKMRAMRIWEREGVPIPSFSEEVPCIGRTRTHTQGQGLWFCWLPEQVREVKREGADYFIKYIPTAQEWRLHILGGEVAFVQYKYPRPRRTSAFGGVQQFRDEWVTEAHPPNTASREIRNIGVRSVTTLGLDVGAPDIVQGLDGSICVLEVNTGPALYRDTIGAYIEYFRSEIRTFERG